MWIVYNILFTVGFVVMLPYFLWRMTRRGGYGRRFMERFGRYRAEVRAALHGTDPVWIHAVSVGEVYVAFQLMESWRGRDPSIRFVLSVNTSTSRRIAERRLRDPDVLIYFPLDFPPIIRSVLRRLHPRALILIECELWPNLIRLAARRRVPMALVNGRISAHSFKGYRRLRFFTRRLLPLVDALCAQDARDAERLIALGAPATKVHVLGSAKYEVVRHEPEGEARAGAALARAGFAPPRLLLLGGSTWPGEEEALMQIYRALKPAFPTLGLVLAPRHAERTPEVLAAIAAQGLRVLRRSALAEEIPAGTPAAAAACDVFLIDTTGELTHFYPQADLIFIGKSLTQHGGQNIIEPAHFGKPILCGPNMENFPGIVDDFLLAKALVQAPDADALREAVRTLLADPAARADLGARATALIREKAGALQRTLDVLFATIRR